MDAEKAAKILLWVLRVILWACVVVVAGAVYDAHAQTSVWVHGVSHHSEGTYNERNYGLGIRYELTDSWSVQAGFYKNSINRQTEYLLAQWQPLEVGPVRVGVWAGYGSGYTTPYPAIAGFMSTLELHEHVLIGVRAIPRINGVTPAVLAADIAWRF